MNVNEDICKAVGQLVLECGIPGVAKAWQGHRLLLETSRRADAHSVVWAFVAAIQGIRDMSIDCGNMSWFAKLNDLQDKILPITRRLM